jgi:hypothetical protein
MDDQNYNSLEKLLEFGMSMSVAQQMMQTMNHAMQNMTTPHFDNVNVPLPQVKHYYALVNDIPQGPFTEQELSGYIFSKSVLKETLVWHQSMQGWLQAQQMPEISKLFALLPNT